MSSPPARKQRETLAPSSLQTQVERSTNPVTLTRFLQSEAAANKTATGSFTLLLNSIQLAVKIIAQYSRHANINITSALDDANNGASKSSSTNSTGDTQKKLDIFANETMINCLRFSQSAYILGSEENDEPIIISSHDANSQEGGYAVVFDPLDGSSNIDCNLSVGTIFAIYHKKEVKNPSIADLLRPGTELAAAGYASYDAATILCLTTGHGVNIFTLDPNLGEFILTTKELKTPKRGKQYSVNEGNALSWDRPMTEYIAAVKRAGDMSGRYVGSMVGDVHRTLLYGGIYCYPSTKAHKNGKLRLLYECNPISFIVEQAGGKSSTGYGRVLELKPTSLHQRCPIFCGSAENVDDVLEMYRKYGDHKDAAQPKSQL